MTAAPIRSIAILGDGVAAWAAAASFARRLRGVAVTLVPPGRRTIDLADHFGTMLPAARDFHHSLGIDERALIGGCTGAMKLGTRMIGWGAAGEDYIRGHGDHGRALGGVPFHQLWIAMAEQGAASRFDRFAPAAALADAGRFLPPAGDRQSPLWGLEVALGLDCAAYRAVLEQGARKAGAVVAPPLGEVALDEQGRIAALACAGSERVSADLYVDASGGDALLLSRLDGGNVREDWRAWLACDRVHIARTAAPADLPLVDIASAERVGWRLESDTRDRRTSARLYEAKRLQDEAAARDLPGGGETVAIAQGRRERAWIGTCVAIGDAAVVIEPLVSPQLHLVQRDVERILALLPGRDFAPVEVARYNRDWAETVDRLRDFAILHHAVSGRPEPFWKTARKADLPPLLAHSLTLFRERGRLPLRDFESFPPESWYAVLLGQGVRPRHADALAGNMDADAFTRFANGFLGAMQQAVAPAPPHRAFLDSLTKGKAA